MTEVREERLLAEIRVAMQESWPGPRLTIVSAFGTMGSIEGVLVERNTRHVGGNGRDRWEQVGVPIYPAEDQTLRDVFDLLLTMREEGDHG